MTTDAYTDLTEAVTLIDDIIADMTSKSTWVATELKNIRQKLHKIQTQAVNIA